MHSISPFQNERDLAILFGTMEFVIPNAMSALEALRHLFPDSSRRTLQNWIKGERFTVDGTPLERDNTLLAQGQVLRSQEMFQPIKKAQDVKILYEDRYLIAIDKPSGLLSVPLDEPSLKRDALSILRKTFNTTQIFPVHRIDREASGVLLFARGTESEEKFKDLFEQHDLEREYFAILEGRLLENKGTWHCCLQELPNYDVIAAEEGKDATTHFEVIRRSPKYTFVRFILETGRKHQIRVHSKLAGCPILGDDRYGSSENPIRRLCLHAKSISFVHPFTGRKLSFTSPIPSAFRKLEPSAEARKTPSSKKFKPTA